jgi:hypothetical protein
MGGGGCRRAKNKEYFMFELVLRRNKIESEGMKA